MVSGEERRTLLPLWLGILVPPAAWSLHLLLGYVVVTAACHASWSRLALTLALNGLTLVLGAITVAAAIVAQRVRDDGLPEAERDRQGFMARMALFSGGLFLLLILAGDVPNFFVPACP
ncbi:MAG TPA: hypothetical protein VK066_18030 [Chloroflexota bacterium]|nr:hypothetical protein [Chloroflexota bacterium]